MVLILDGSSKNTLHTHEGKYVFSDKKYPICDCSRTNQKVKEQSLLLTCAPIYELPSNIITMRRTYLAPSVAKCRAVPAPMPELAPVMSTTLFLRSDIIN